MSGARAPAAVTQGVLLSTLLHGLMVAAVVWWSQTTPPPTPPAYRVRLVGAPPGPRQAGVVNATPKPAAAAPTAAGAERPPVPEKALPSTAKSATVTSPKATPVPNKSRETGAKTASATPAAKAAPRAGSGAQGGKGADVANVDLRGIAFPYQGYLDNIVRQLTLNWSPRRRATSLVAEIKFMIRRDGSIAGMEVVRRSGDGIYDLDAQGAVEAVGAARGFGPLPSGWQDDVLVVYFTFDYALRP